MDEIPMQESFVHEEAVNDSGPSMMNAFELITLSQGLNLSALFEKPQVWGLNFDPVPTNK